MHSDILDRFRETIDFLDGEVEEPLEEENEVKRYTEHFDMAKSIEDKVNWLTSYIEVCELNSLRYNERIKELKARADRWQKKKDSLERYGLWLLNNFPDVEYRGTNVRLTKKLNPGSLTCPGKITKSFSNAINPAYVDQVPLEYREPVVTWTLKTDKVKTDLKAGTPLMFAGLERKEVLVMKSIIKEEK